MVKIRKYANFIERFLNGPGGQRFFNIAYSIGAAVVIWGALFKILHIRGGDILLCIGMGTEIAMFILTAFDRPPREYNWEDVFPVLDSGNPEDRPDFQPGNGVAISGSASITSGNEKNPSFKTESSSGSSPAAGSSLSGNPLPLSEDDASMLHESIRRMTEQMDLLQETARALNDVSGILLQSYKTITDNSEEISRSAMGYAGQMSDLNRNLSGLNTIYEIQLKHVSGQLENIDRVNRGLREIRDMFEKSAGESSRYCEETEKMARYMRQINAVYEKMIAAMTVNMGNPVMRDNVHDSSFSDEKNSTGSND